MKVRIIADSTSIPAPPLSELLEIVPMTVTFGDEEYIDGVTITRQEFYEKMAASDVLPKTSQAGPAAYANAYRKVTEAGESAVVIAVGAHLSGTYQSAVMAAEGFDNIYVVDSGSVAIGAGILTARALELAEAGMDAASIAQTLEAEKGKIYMVCLLDTLDNLQRSGRISKGLAFAGTLLHIKPLVAVRDSQIVMAGKARGDSQGKDMILRHIKKQGGIDWAKPILLGYTGLSDAPLKEFLEKSKDFWAVLPQLPPISSVGGAIGTHAGPGAFAVAFFRN